MLTAAAATTTLVAQLHLFPAICPARSGAATLAPAPATPAPATPAPA
jgi:hypothetical protein